MYPKTDECITTCTTESFLRFVCDTNTYASILGFRGSLTEPAAKRLVP